MGGVIVTKAKAGSLQIAELSKFQQLFEALTGSHFRMAYHLSFRNKLSEDFTNSVFGNYLAKDITIEDFIKSDKQVLLESL